VAAYGSWCFQAPNLANVRTTGGGSGINNQAFAPDKAWAHLLAITGDLQPHPTGSDSHNRVRDYLMEQLESYGYQVTCEPSDEMTIWQKQSPLQNIIAWRKSEPFPPKPSGTLPSGRLEPTDAAPTIEAEAPPQDTTEHDSIQSTTPAPRLLVFACHYDSHPNGPGAGDDSAAVAALLEVARIESERPVGKREIVFLITDGEEAGLLGAKHWIKTCDWLDRIDLIFNFEARGSNGAVFLFETSFGNQNLIRDFAGLSPRPVGTSLAYEVYKYMPNGTDFMVFKKASLNGLNFAFVGDVKNYHTPQDNPDNLDPNSLNHQGKTALALLNHYRNIADIPTSSSNAVYFDIAGLVMLWWPESWNYVWLVSCMLLLGFTIVYCSRGSLRDLLFAVSAAGLLTFTMATLIWIAGIGFDQRQWLVPFWGRDVAIFGPNAALLAFWCMALIGWAFIGSAVEMITKDKSLWIAIWLLWLGLSGLTVILTPGASYLFLIPLGLACCLRIFGRFFFPISKIELIKTWDELKITNSEKTGEEGDTKRHPAENPWFLVVLPCIATWFLWMPTQCSLFSALGYRYPSLYAILIPLMLTPTLPLAAHTSFRTKIRLIIGASSLLAVILACFIFS